MPWQPLLILITSFKRCPNLLALCPSFEITSSALAGGDFFSVLRLDRKPTVSWLKNLPVRCVFPIDDSRRVQSLFSMQKLTR